MGGHRIKVGLLIHDLSPEEWAKVSREYDSWDIVTDNGSIRPCVGCFSCWNRDPGRCAIKDGYDNMGARIHHADEVVVISRYTFGGFSGFVKNVFDRCLGYVLPQFEVAGGESHHQKRYDEDKPFTFIFYGHGLSDDEKNSAKRYVTAVCANIRGHVKDIIFRESEAEEAVRTDTSVRPAGGRTVLLNGSMRNRNGNSAKLAKQLAARLEKEVESIDLKDWMKDMSGLVRKLEDAPAIVFCIPLYVDGLPSQVIRLMEKFGQEYRGGVKKIYVLANMGLYESSQLVNLFYAVTQWSRKMGFEYCGGLGVSAGELIGGLMEMIPFGKGPIRKTSEGMDLLARAINSGSRTYDIYAEPKGFPKWLFIQIANNNWDRLAKKNGIDPKELYRQL